jgi:type I restriction enzyme, S subunit
MSALRYPDYTDSGTLGLGSVPSHWTLTRLGRVTASKCDGPFGSGLKSDHYTDSGVRVVRLQNIRACAFNDDDAAFIDESYAEEELQRHAVKTGDLLIAGLGDERNTVGRACVAPHGIEPAIVKADCFRFRLRTSEALPSFLAYQLSATSHVDAAYLSSGSTRSRIPLSEMASRSIAVPPLNEQQAIASFLHRETAKIDALVAEQERLMALLREKRQAVISHAVTKGLNADAPMKASGVEWLGEIPAHWDVVPIKWLSPVRRGASPRPIDDPKYFDVEGEYAWVRIADVSASSGVLHETTQRLSALGSSLSVKLEPGALFISIAGTVGKPCRTAIPACIHDGFVYFPSLQMNQDFLFHIFDSGLCYGGLGKMGTQLNLNTDTIGSIRIPHPPADEVDAILSHLQRELDRLAELSTAVESSISMLAERRAALITAAVTGQIDVRHLAPADAA